jgi:FMN-dependent oxidoreductase (nitrilotriacetate monooxygenase family)
VPALSRPLHLNLFLQDAGHHDAAWRLPESDPAAVVSLAHYANLARIAEDAKFDSLFLADALALIGEVRRRSAASRIEPLTLLAALAATTSRIGLIATASTTYGHPFDVARRFAGLDHISGGRAGWNIVTSAGDALARNYGFDEQAAHADRYRDAEEFVQVVTRLWDSWEDGAMVADKEAGVFIDDERLHPIDHRGRRFAVQGPLDVPRPPQGQPVRVQAGSSDRGRDFAARHAEAVFTAQLTIDGAREFYADLKARVAAHGRDPHAVKILPGLVPIVGATAEEALALEARLDAVSSTTSGLQMLSFVFGTDLTGLELDAPLPPAVVEHRAEGHQSRSALLVRYAQEHDLTVRQLIGRTSGGRGHRVVVGDATTVADVLQEWLEEGAADGFNLMPPTLPGSLRAFADHVVPELQRRGIFRRDYEGTTLREHLGLPRPARAA